MSAEAIVTVSAAVVALVQVIKWALRRDGWGPAIVLLVSLLGVAVWAVSQGDATWASAWSYFAGWVAVATSAAGVYGFTQAGVARFTQATAGASRE
jgi:hypothetical protein